MHSSKQIIISPMLKSCPARKGQALLFIVLLLASLACRARVYAADASDTFYGVEAGASTTTSGINDSAFGYFALYYNTTGSSNTASGYFALHSNITGSGNTASGSGALESNTADNNTATGFNALMNNTTGPQNTADGTAALQNNTTGFNNTANGFDALINNTKGGFNTATGSGALASNTIGGSNTAHGANALVFNTTGNKNTADGNAALENNTTGSSNIALGYLAGANLTTGSSNIDIGNTGVPGEAKTIRIGKQRTQVATFIAGISGKTVAGGVGVVINSQGQLGTVQSSARFKQDIKPMDKASEALLKLKPVTFRYKEELDPDRVPQFGLIAEEVEKVDPDLVVKDEDGKVSSVRYEAVNAMLLNEFLKARRELDEQKATVAQQQKQFQAKLAQQQMQIEALTAGLQKVNAKVELRSPVTRTAANDQ